jgi:serine/threonine-protein kinase
LETITLKCMEKDPNRRYQSARELAAEFRRYLSGQPILARPITRMAHAWRWCKRKPAVAALSGTLLLVLTAAAIISPLVALRQAGLRQRAQDQLARNLFQRACAEYRDGHGKYV